MKSINATLVLAKQELPDGMQPGLFEVTLSFAGAPDVVQTTAETGVVFANLAPGDYTITAVRLAESGERISAPVSASIVVPAPEQIDVPASITLTLG